MTNRERSFWDGFIKAALSQEALNSFPPEIAPYLAQGMDVNQAFDAGGTAMGKRLDQEVAPTAQKLQNIQGTDEAAKITAELNDPRTLDPSLLEGSNKYINDLLNRADSRMTDFKSVKPQISPELIAQKSPMTQDQVNNMPLTSVGAPPATPPTQPTPMTAGQSQPPPAQPGMPGWMPWALGGAATLGAAGLGTWYANKKRKEQQQPEQPQQKPIEPPVAQNQKKRKLGSQQAAIV